MTQYLKDIQSYSEQLQAQITGGNTAGHELQEIASGIALSVCAAIAEAEPQEAQPIAVVEPVIVA